MKAKMPKVTLEVDVRDVIVVTEDHGGYRAGYYFACRVSGWIYRYGYPAWTTKAPGSHLKHKDFFPMNDVLNDDGSLNTPGCRGE